MRGNEGTECSLKRPVGRLACHYALGRTLGVKRTSFGGLNVLCSAVSIRGSIAYMKADKCHDTSVGGLSINKSQGM